jgi:hypothetical protein
VLACDVFDFVFAGMSQPLIGSMNIKIGEIKTKTRAKNQELQKELDKVIAELTDFNNSQDIKGTLMLKKETSAASKVLLSEPIQTEQIQLSARRNWFDQNITAEEDAVNQSDKMKQI